MPDGMRRLAVAQFFTWLGLLYVDLLYTSSSN